MKKIIILAVLLLQTACSTLSESLELGATMGAVTGAAASYAAYSRNDEKPSLENIAIGAGIGLGIGLLTSHAVHRSVEKDRQANQLDEMEVHFGDLPPSPFIMPKLKPNKGGRQ